MMAQGCRCLFPHHVRGCWGRPWPVPVWLDGPPSGLRGDLFAQPKRKPDSSSVAAGFEYLHLLPTQGAAFLERARTDDSAHVSAFENLGCSVSFQCSL